MAFDPDAYIAKNIAPPPETKKGKGGFDPDAYIAKIKQASSPQVDDRDVDAEVPVTPRTPDGPTIITSGNYRRVVPDDNVQAVADERFTGGHQAGSVQQLSDSQTARFANGRVVSPRPLGKDYLAQPLMPIPTSEEINADRAKLTPLQLATKYGPLAEMTEGPAAAIATDVIGQTASGLSTPENLALMSATGGVYRMAKGGSTLAKAALTAMDGYFAKTGVEASSGQVAKALDVTSDPNAKTEDIARAWAEVLPPAALTAAGTLSGVKQLSEMHARITDAIRTPAPAEPAAKAAPVDAVAAAKNVTGTAGPEAPPEAPAATPSAPPPPVPAKPSLVALIDAVDGTAKPGQINTAINATIVNPAPVAPEVAPEAPAVPAVSQPSLTAAPAESPAPVAEGVADYGKTKVSKKVGDIFDLDGPEAGALRVVTTKPLTLSEAQKINPNAKAGDAIVIDILGAKRGKTKDVVLGQVPEDTAKSGIALTKAQATEQLDYVAKMDHADFVAYANNALGGYTTAAITIGKTLGPDAADMIQKRADAIKADFDKALEQASKDPAQMQVAMSLANKNQFLSEAAQAARGTLDHLSLRSPTTKSSAIRKPAAGQVDVRQQASDGQGVGIQNQVDQVSAPSGGGGGGETPPAGPLPQSAAQSLTLPKELAGAKPRYGYGSKLFQLDFKSDLDKALYIISQPKPSKADAAYLDLVKQATGLSEAKARALGQTVRNRIKALAKDAPVGQPLVITPSNESKVSVGQRPVVNQKPKARKGPAQPAQDTGTVQAPQGAGTGNRPVAPAGEVPSAAPAVGSPPPPVKPPEAPPAAPAPDEEPLPTEEKRQEMITAIQQASKKAIGSPNVDVWAKRQILHEIARLAGGDLGKLGDLPFNVVRSLLDKIAALNKIGRRSVKSRDQARKEEVSGLMEMMGEEAGKSRAINLAARELNPGERLSAPARVRAFAKNRLADAMNTAIKAGVYLNTRDVELDTLDGYQNYKGFLSRYLGGDLDRNWNAKLILAEKFREPLAQLMHDKPLDSASLNRIGMYAIARQGLANRVLESGAKPDVLFPPKGQTGPHQLLELTPDEQAFYDAGRKMLDDVGAQVERIVRDELNLDFHFVKDYAPLQRDYRQYEPKPEPPDLRFAKGDEVVQGVMESFKDLFSDFMPKLTSTPNKTFTIERLPGASGPVRLDWAEMLEQHIQRASHLIAYAHDLRKWGKIARSPQFAKQYGVIGQRYILDLLDTAARNAAPAGTQGSAIADAMMKNMNAAILGLRFLSQMKHVTNISSAVLHVPFPHLARAFSEVTIPDGKANMFLREYRPDIANRFGGEDSIMELVGVTSPLHKVNSYRKVQNMTFGLERGVDSVIARASWLGSYMEGLAKLGYDPMDYAKLPLQAEPARMADIKSRKVVTSPKLIDSPQALSRNKLTMGNSMLKRAWFAFQSTMLSQNSNYMHDIFGAGIQKGNYLGAAMATLAAISIISGEVYITHMNRLFKQAMFGGPEPKKVSWGSEVAHDMLRRVPVVGPFAATIMDRDLGVPVVSTALLIKDSAKHLMTGRNEKGGTLTPNALTRNYIDLSTGVGSVLGVPGITTFGEGLKTILTKP